MFAPGLAQRPVALRGRPRALRRGRFRPRGRWLAAESRPRAPALGVGPVRLERGDELTDDRVAAYEHAHLAPFVQLEAPQALTADERLPAVARLGADWQEIGGAHVR